jgi:hypothetical protein
MMSVAAVAALLAGGCSSNDDARGTTSPPGPATNPAPSPAPTDAPITTTSASAASETTAAGDAATGLAELLGILAADDLRGRDNASPDAATTRSILVERLSPLARPWDEGAGDAGYLQPFAEGTNVIGVIPGADLADEYVMVGAHYDHLAVGDCRNVTPADDICNGAADNAAGVVAAMAIAEAIAAEGPRRSVIVAFWDAEEDGLLGARAFAENPIVPLDQIVTYVNFDIQGANLLPSLAGSTLAIGSETGGPALSELVDEVTSASALTYAALSLITGQGRSDHAPLADAGVPVVFLTDANNGCYHTVDDEIASIDIGKLTAQTATATELVRRLANDDIDIAFDATAPVTTFADAERILELAQRGERDLARLDAATAATATAIIGELEAVVAAGAEAYDSAAQGRMLAASAQLVDLLADLDCAPAPGP